MSEKFTGTAFSYIRFSAKEQERGDSIRRQRELRDDWLKQNPAVTLDTTLGGEDRGVSAFRGRNRTDKHHLGRFLEAVRRGRVAAGSILLLESLDRLSRQEEEEALALLLSLLNANVVIVQLEPLTTFRKGDGMMGLMRALIYLSRAREESSTKSKRVTQAWLNKQRDATESGKMMTAAAPRWLHVVNGQFQFKPGAAATLKRIYRRSIEGQGSRMIAHDLHQDGVPHFEDGHRWESTYITQILMKRATTGEFQPMHRMNGKRVPRGVPIPDYFPRAVSDADWHAARKAARSRKKKGGRRGNDGWVALFGPVYCARTGERLQAILRVDRGRRYHVLQPSGVLRWQTKCVSFPIASFEAAVLSELAELDIRDILPPVEDGGKVAELSGRLAELESRIARLQSAMVEGEKDEAALPVLRELDERRKKLANELAVAQQEVASPAHEMFGTLKGLAKAVENDPEARIRVRGAAGRIIERIDVMIVAEKPKSQKRLAAVQVLFRDRPVTRSYLILHENSKHGPKGKELPARWEARAFVKTGLPTLDLRDRKQAATLEKAIARNLEKSAKKKPS